MVNLSYASLSDDIVRKLCLWNGP